MKLLVTGGAGYIGSHTVKKALDIGHDVVVLDNFSSGHKWACFDTEIIEVDLLDNDKLNRLLLNRRFDGIIHFAAKSIVSESIKDPISYYLNNVTGSLNLLNSMIKNDNNNIVFSSSAAIFGNPESTIINENHRKKPINPYGKTKLIVENILYDLFNLHSVSSISLRYFNAAGADPSSKIGEAHEPETHLIPNVINSVIKEEQLKIFGNDFDTYDGTSIRDYIHVNDLADAHLRSINYLERNEGSHQFNLGNGKGFSVMDVINETEKVCGKPINYVYEQRRSGDPSTLIADSSKIKTELNWEAEYTNLNDIIKTAYDWHMNFNKSKKYS
jgi:UDP-glucose 4-epimerase